MLVSGWIYFELITSILLKLRSWEILTLEGHFLHKLQYLDVKILSPFAEVCILRGQISWIGPSEPQCVYALDAQEMPQKLSPKELGLAQQFSEFTGAR